MDQNPIVMQQGFYTEKTYTLSCPQILCLYFGAELNECSVDFFLYKLIADLPWQIENIWVHVNQYESKPIRHDTRQEFKINNC